MLEAYGTELKEERFSTNMGNVQIFCSCKKLIVCQVMNISGPANGVENPYFPMEIPNLEELQYCLNAILTVK